MKSKPEGEKAMTTSETNSKMTTCPDCSQSISRKADACPNCGRRMTQSSAGVFGAIGIGLGIIVLLWLLAGSL